jgi:gliding motility-associated protein GldC
MSTTNTSDITLRVTLDANKVPEKIHWDATDNNVIAKEAKAMMLSVWDPTEDNTLRVDLWTKEMVVDDMKKFIHQSILLMADTLQRSTGEIAMAETMRDFGAYYAEKLGLITPEEKP